MNMKTVININQINFEKMNGLVPAVVQDVSTLKLLMVGFMNEQALQQTITSRKVTFFSRTKNKLWTKGEESGNFLKVIELYADCDDDTILVKADPAGPVCHTGADTCFFEENNERGIGFITYLQDLIDKRRAEMPEGSYTTELFNKGTAAIAQKVGEEAVETLIGSLTGDDENFLYESADLLYHLIVLLSDKGYRIEDVAEELKRRHK